MMEEWKEYKLGTLTDRKIGYGIVQPGASVFGGVPVIKVNNIISGLRKVEELETTSKANDAKYSRTKLMGGELIISVVGTIGKTAIVPMSFAGCNLVRATCLIDIKDKQLASWVKYYIDSPQGQRYIHENLNTTVQPTLNVKSLVDMPIPIYSSEYMKKVVSILSSLDDKIEVNRKINENLEQQAQALFKSWFVDFEPFRDGEFVESELGMIPKGWRVGSLSEIAEYINGLAMQKFRPEEGEKGLPVLKIKELGQGGFDDNSELCSPSLIGKKYIINDGDIIFSWSGTLMVKIWCGGKCGLNQHLFIVAPKETPKWFVYQWTQYHLDNFIRIAKDKAVTMGHIKRGELDKAKVSIPDEENMEKINSLMEPIFNQIISNELESRRLATLRDTLLPRLMSGELKVNEKA
ncbi:MAG: restriction endonuclease subunit S [Prevotella sp.]|nr:restriction endonuclease subunit S [Prevotella sp.]